MSKHPDVMREREAAAYLTEKSGRPFGPASLRGRRHRRTGPAFILFTDRRVRYRKVDLDDWLEGWMRRVETKESGE